MGSVKMEDFSFEMFDSKTKTIEKFGKNIVTTEQVRIGNENGLVLNDKEAIVNKRKGGNRNIENFKPFFYNVEKRRHV